jgi:hypothetical protein
MQRPKQRKMRNWIAVHAIHRSGAGYHKASSRRQYDPRMELLDYEESVPMHCQVDREDRIGVDAWLAWYDFQDE